MDEPSRRYINKKIKIKHTKLLEVQKNDEFQRSCFDSPQSKGN